MRVLHTADWHLGQRLAGHDRSEEHAHFLQWLLRCVRDREVDLLMVAGDVFDTAHPPQATMQLYYDFLRDLSAVGECAAVIVGGNHDSPAHLNAPSGLLKRFQIHVVGSPSSDRDDDLIKITPGVGMLDAVCVCAVPYLRDRDVLQVVVGEATGQREERLREGVYQYYHDISRRAQAYRDRAIPVIATGHLTMQSTGTEIEKEELHIGTLGALEESKFPQDFDYVALGHLHAPHAVEGSSCMRYSGSPFPMSFSESDHDKSVTLLDFVDGQLQATEILPIPQTRCLHRFLGTLDTFERWLDDIPQHSKHSLPPWIEVHLTDEVSDPQVTEHIRGLVADRPMEVLKVIKQSTATDTNQTWTGTNRALQDYAPQEVFAERCRHAGWESDDPEAQRASETFEELLSLHEARQLELAD